jgi:hypothetical protein
MAFYESESGVVEKPTRRLGRLKRVLAKKLRLVKEERKKVEEWKARLENELSNIRQDFRKVNDKIDFGVYKELEQLRAKDDELKALVIDIEATLKSELKEILGNELKSRFLEILYELKKNTDELKKETDNKLVAVSSTTELLKNKLATVSEHIAKLENNVVQNLNSALTAEQSAREKFQQSILNSLEIMRTVTDAKLQHVEKGLNELNADIRRIELQGNQRIFFGEQIYPFVAIVGQERMKRALILNVINPAIGGVVLWGLKGNGKFTTIRGLSEIVPKTDRCRFFYCKNNNCIACERRYSSGALPLVTVFGKCIGTYMIDWLTLCSAVTIDATPNLQFSFSPVSLPSILTRTSLVIEVKMVEDYELGIEIIKRREEFTADSERFRAKYEKEQQKLRDKILEARARLPDVLVSEDIYKMILQITATSKMNSIATLVEQLARAQASYENRSNVTVEDVIEASEIVFPKKATE